MTDRCTPTRWAKFKFSGPHCIFHSAICCVSETPEHQKIQNWVKRASRGLNCVTYILNFATPSISLEWLHLQTSNLVLCILTVYQNFKI